MTPNKLTLQINELQLALIECLLRVFIQYSDPPLDKESEEELDAAKRLLADVTHACDVIEGIENASEA